MRLFLFTIVYDNALHFCQQIVRDGYRATMYNLYK